MPTLRGNCYVTSEALYHLLGGKAAGWVPMRLTMADGETHWWLENRRSGQRLDATALQFGPSAQPDYSKGVGAGFLTKAPSRRAKALMQELLWQVKDREGEG